MFSDMVLLDDLEGLQAAEKGLGVECFILAKDFKSMDELKKLREKIRPYKNFKTCFLARKADQKAIQRFYGKADFIAVLGGSVSLNKFASSSREVDFLVAPCTAEKASIDTAIIRTAKENNVSIVALAGDFAKASLFQRSQLLKHYLLTARLCGKFMVKFFVFSLAKNLQELKQADELVGMGKDFGFSEKQLRGWHGGL